MGYPRLTREPSVVTASHQPRGRLSHHLYNNKHDNLSILQLYKHTCIELELKENEVVNTFLLLK